MKHFSDAQLGVYPSESESGDSSLQTLFKSHNICTITTHETI